MAERIWRVCSEINGVSNLNAAHIRIHGTRNPPGDTYGNFSETQTESQVVGYEKDLSGRQMLIVKVRTRSSLT
ncbi:BnaCnng09740D [Brassica napus]|uniref:(rape) hypothetical protein n=1 Tax=Brassica napus TaxID=3708 RepID=A0A078HVR1_BRANA|nr:unnamed protein product [Brassica napus]CDY40883.1 BnaCnng09740D [Brassica napus]